MKEEEIREQIRRLAPFYHNVELPYGLRTYIPELSRRDIERTRCPNLIRHAFSPLMQACGGSLRGLRVLDVGCSCGGFSVEASKRGAEYVLGIDTADRYIEQANFIKEALELKNVEFKKMHIEDVEEATVGQFDVVFCFGILYHLENPVFAMRKLSNVCRRIMLVDCTVMRKWFDHDPLWRMNFPPVATLSDRDASTSLWREKKYCQFTPNAEAVSNLLHFLGFANVRRLKPRVRGLEKEYYTGKWVTFLAIRDLKSRENYKDRQ